MTMAGLSEEGACRVRLVGQHLHENEVLDGTFEVSPERLVAVTSERIMIVSGGGAKGWALTWIPWRVVTGVEFEAAEPAGVSTVHVNYTVGPLNRKGVAMETEMGADLCPDTAELARQMVHLMNSRRIPA